MSQNKMSLLEQIRCSGSAAHGCSVKRARAQELKKHTLRLLVEAHPRCCRAWLFRSSYHRIVASGKGLHWPTLCESSLLLLFMCFLVSFILSAIYNSVHLVHNTNSNTNCRCAKVATGRRRQPGEPEPKPKKKTSPTCPNHQKTLCSFLYA